jgi:glycosyltransferase involved in cell wall biosynthesis
MTDRGGAPGFVRDGVDGILVDPESLEELAAAIRRVLDDPALAARLADAASLRVRDFTWARVAERYDALYDDVLAAVSHRRR